MGGGGAERERRGRGRVGEGGGGRERENTDPVEHGTDVFTLGVLHEDFHHSFNVPAPPFTIPPRIVA